MRSRSLPKLLPAALLGCLLLSACGTKTGTGTGTGTEQVSAGSAVSASPTAAAPQSGDQQEMRFLDLSMRTLKICAPDTPQPSATGEPPKPGELPGWDGPGTPGYGPGRTPPGVPDANGDIRVPVSELPPPPSSKPTPSPRPEQLQEVPLDALETCEGREHAKRIVEAFENTGATGHDAMHRKLTGLDYPTARIHRMPEHAGSPRVRIDLRFMAGYLGLEVTGTGTGVTVEPFGIPDNAGAADEDENQREYVTSVIRKATPDGPAS
ncbi:hypothetical protein [Streptomyces sp. NPDC089799]|uniref:hypothetical protein n=1 Tax=Streptomyces sp. NPDC089799 TaxID=3155066 RepID=UPI00342C130E